MNVPGLCMAVGPLSPDTLHLAAGSISYLDESMAYIAESLFTESQSASIDGATILQWTWVEE